MRSSAALALSFGAGSAMHSSSGITKSEPSTAWMSIASSGRQRFFLPASWNSTPSSRTTRFSIR
jgi:hypothetical protein